MSILISILFRVLGKKLKKFFYLPKKLKVFYEKIVVQGKSLEIFFILRYNKMVGCYKEIKIGGK